jgi:hypothetical protein
MAPIFQSANSRFTESSFIVQCKQPAANRLVVLAITACGEVGRTIPQLVLGMSGAHSVASMMGLRCSSSRNSFPPQRIQVFRGLELDTDITIPQEHSRTGMPHSPVLSAQLS